MYRTAFLAQDRGFACALATALLVVILAVVEGRIDQMALLAFDLFMRCRERIYEIKENEAKRRTALLERMYAPESSAGAHG
jgi:hypothetical protein